MRLRTRKSLRSDFSTSVEYPSGCEIRLVEPLDVTASVWLMEVRLPDASLVGDASYDLVTGSLDDLDVDMSGNALAEDIRSAQGDEESDRLAARVVDVHDVLLPEGAKMFPRDSAPAPPPA
jgi:hypothetical protein